MTRETKVMVYSNGAFCEQPAPDWYREAEELEASGLDWHAALSRALGTDPSQYADPLGDAGIDICVWRSANLGVYVETGDCLRSWDAVWVLLSSDWWSFQAQYLLPFLATASNLAIADRLSADADASGISVAGRHQRRRGNGYHGGRVRGQSNYPNHSGRSCGRQPDADPERHCANCR